MAFDRKKHCGDREREREEAESVCVREAMSSEAAYNARLQEIRSRQENWMKQRQSAIEREKVEHEIISSRADSYDAPLSSGHASTSSQGSTVGSKMDSTIQKVAPEELVDALTIRLAEKIKAELQLEDRAELGKVQARVQREKANVNKLEGYLAKEIASCKCPICLELMVSSSLSSSSSSRPWIQAMQNTFLIS